MIVYVTKYHQIHYCTKAIRTPHALVLRFPNASSITFKDVMTHPEIPLASDSHYKACKITEVLNGRKSDVKYLQPGDNIDSAETIVLFRSPQGL